MTNHIGSAIIRHNNVAHASPAIGIDTVAISIPMPAWVRTSRTSMPGGGFIQLRHRTAWIEGSLPKRRHGHNLELLDAETAALELGHMVTEATGIIDVDVPDLDALVISRLDVAQDFQMVEDRSAFLHALGLLPPRGRATTALVVDRPTQTFGTLAVATQTSWMVRFYDKSLQMAGDERANGVMRLEGEFRNRALARSRWARDHGVAIGFVGDLDDRKVAAFVDSAAARINLPEVVAHPFEEGVVFDVDRQEGRITRRRD